MGLKQHLLSFNVSFEEIRDIIGNLIIYRRDLVDDTIQIYNLGFCIYLIRKFGEANDEKPNDFYKWVLGKLNSGFDRELVDLFEVSKEIEDLRNRFKLVRILEEEFQKLKW